MEYILGVDGGNSITYAVIVEGKGNRVGHGMSGNDTYQGIGRASISRNIQLGIDRSLTEAELSYNAIRFAQFGLVGADKHSEF